METCVRSSRKRRPRRKKRQKELNISREESKSPSRYLGISKRMIRKGSGKKIQIRNQYLKYFIPGSCKRPMSNQNYEKGLAECNNWEKNLLEETIDLFSADSAADNSGSNFLSVPSSKLKKRDEVIDLSKDLPDQNEIIDLTEIISTPKNCLSSQITLEPSVVDISEDNLEDQPDFKPENDEIFVIGTFYKEPNGTEKHEIPSIISFPNTLNNSNNLITCSEKLKKMSHKRLSVFEKIDKKNMNQFRKGLWRPKENLAKVGENIYVNTPMTLPSSGLRPIIIDGSNVAFVHSNCNFSCKRLEICINYFKEKGHKVTAFVPQYRINSRRSDDPWLLRQLERQGDVVFTPSKKIDGRNIVPYDDRFIVQTAVLKGGIIVTRDNYNDLLKENPAWAETIKYRTLAFTWVEDVLIFPKDPLGECGPSLEEFLRFN